MMFSTAAAAQPSNCHPCQLAVAKNKNMQQLNRSVDQKMAGKALQEGTPLKTIFLYHEFITIGD